MARRSAAAESNHRVGRAHLKPMLIISGPQLGATGAFRPSRGAGCTDAGPNRGAPAAPMFIKNRAMSARFHPKFRTPPAPDFFPMRDPFIEPKRRIMAIPCTMSRKEYFHSGYPSAPGSDLARLW